MKSRARPDLAPTNLLETKTFQFCKKSRPETMSRKIRHLVSERLHSFLGRTNRQPRFYILPGGK